MTGSGLSLAHQSRWIRLWLSGRAFLSNQNFIRLSWGRGKLSKRLPDPLRDMRGTGHFPKPPTRNSHAIEAKAPFFCVRKVEQGLRENHVEGFRKEKGGREEGGLQESRNEEGSSRSQESRKVDLVKVGIFPEVLKGEDGHSSSHPQEERAWAHAEPQFDA